MVFTASIDEFQVQQGIGQAGAILVEHPQHPTLLGVLPRMAVLVRHKACRGDGLQYQRRRRLHTGGDRQRSVRAPRVAGPVGGWPALKGGKSPPDTDRDGMPDAWETANGLNPHDATDRNADRDHDGYTNLEEYLNGLVR